MKIALIVFNLIVIGLGVSIVLLMKWSGPGFALGCVVGFFSWAIYARQKMGYWV